MNLLYERRPTVAFKIRFLKFNFRILNSIFIEWMRALNHGKLNPATAPRRKRAKAYRIVR